MVRTVTGDIEAKTLGFCQCHEHLFIERCKSFDISPLLLMDDLDKSSAELELYRSVSYTHLTLPTKRIV